MIFNNNNKYQILTEEGFKPFDGINKVIHNKSVILYFDTGKKLQCSLDHIVFINGTEIRAKDVKLYACLDGQPRTLVICKAYSNKPIELYDPINVGINKTYLSNCVKSHNCDFVGSGDTLITNAGLNSLGAIPPIETTDNNNFRIFKYPEENHAYIAIADVAEGVGNDYSTIQIIDLTNENDGWTQVAVYQNNLINVNDFPMVIENICTYYNNALLIGENNALGAEVLNDIVFDYEYENVFFDSSEDKHRHGLRMTTRSKKLGNVFLKKYIEEGTLKIVDNETIYELSTYAKKGRSYAAMQGKHDDLVTPLVLFGYFMRNSAWVENWIDINADNNEYRKKLQERIEEDVMPAGFVNRGNGIEDLNDTDLYFC